jgi:hypothetical protein
MKTTSKCLLTLCVPNPPSPRALLQAMLATALALATTAL